ncbi:MAG: TonB family protein, partial [Paracoccaceae bacterium]|nr:TonB family protein [Paracoccaceae bacterium]
EMARPQPGLVTGTVQVTLISRLPPDPTPAALSHPFAPPSLAAPPPQTAPDAPAPDRPLLSPPQALPAAPLARLNAPASETAPEPMDLPPPPTNAKAAPQARPQPHPQPQTPPLPARTTPKAPSVEQPPQPRKAAPQPAARAASGGAPSRAGQAGAQGPSQAQMSLMAGWARALVGRIEQHKRYPVAAGDARGVVTLQIALDPGGRLLSVEVAQGSGSAALDLAALQAVRAAAPFSRAPEGLSANRYDFRLQVRYAPTW